MKKILNLLILFLFVTLLVSCTNFNNSVNDDFDNTVINTKFVNKSNEYHIDNDNIDLYYYDGNHLPYVNVIDFINLLNGVYDSELFEFIVDDLLKILTINIELIYEDDEIYNYQMKLHSDDDTIYVDSLDFFESYLIQTETDFGQGLVYLDPIYTEGRDITYELANFDFEIKFENNNFLLPLVIANLFFNQGNYLDVYYNGESLYAIDTSNYNDPSISDIITSKYNSRKEPDDLSLNNYNFYRLLLTYFYGLNDNINVDNFINSSTFLRRDSNRSILNTTIELDELHSSFISKGFYNNKKFPSSYSLYSDGPSVQRFYDEMNSIVVSASEHFGVKSGFLDLEDLDYEYLNNNTVIIYLLEFDIDTPIGIEEIIETLPSNITNVIIDLSLNTGGNLGAVLRMFTLFTEKAVWYHSKNPLNAEKVSYGVIGDQEPYNSYNYFIKTSSITFSAANLAASIAKELDIKVIGTKSSGGASGLGFFVFPNGAIINLSSNLVLTDKNYHSIEDGIIPDIILNKNDLYNSGKIIEAIN